jgi:hypothetical protein
VSRGAVESNPVLGGVADNQAVIWVVKGAAAVGSIYMAERLWKRRQRGPAIAVMVLSNAVMAVVAVRNAAVLRQTAQP